jgi:hypothetical protein
MPNVIDELIIRLALDPAEFVKGHKAALESFEKLKAGAGSTSKELEERGKQASQYFGGIKREALELFGVLVGAGGLEQFVTRTATGMSAVGREAKLAGVAVRDFVAYTNMIARTGADPKAAGATLSGLAERMQAYRTRGEISPEMITALNAIGGNDPKETAMQEMERFYAWAGKQRDPQRVNQIGKMLGVNDEGSLANAMKGAAGFRSGMAESYRLGVPTDDDIGKMNALTGAANTLSQALTGDANALLFKVSPALTGALNLTNRLVGANRTLVQTVEAITAAVVAWGTLKAPAWILRLLGIGGPAAAMKATEHAAVRLGGRAVGAAARVAGPLGFAFDLLNPDPLNVGEDAHMAEITARFRAAHKDAGSSSGLPAGVMAGLYAESQLNPRAFNPAGGGRGAWGIGQWRGSRLDDFAAFAGHDIKQSTLAEQLAFVAYELKHKKAAAGTKIAAASTDAAALGAFIRYFEAPKAGAQINSDLVRGLRWLDAHRHAAAFSGNGKTAPVTIGALNVTVNTTATHVPGIARDIGSAVRTQISKQANMGLD